MQHGNNMEYIENGKYVKFKCKNYVPNKYDPHCSTDPSRCPIYINLVSKSIEGRYECVRGVAEVSWTTYIIYSSMGKIK